MRSLLVFIGLAGCANDHLDVTGRFVDRFYTVGGLIERPSDLSTRGFRVFSNGAWYPSTGLVEGAFDGTIYIPDVPAGPYVLNVVWLDGQMTWQQHEDHEILVVTSRVGRPDAKPALNVPLHTQLAGLAPWNTSDILVADCWENGTEHYPMPLGSLAAGATQVDATFDWADTSSTSSGSDAFLMTDGDSLTVSRLAYSGQNRFWTYKLTQTATGPAPMQSDGLPSEFAATFTDVPATTSHTFTVDVPAFAAELPGEGGTSWGVTLLESPGSLALERFGVDLITVGRDDDTSTTPVTTTGTYGNPFDPTWQLMSLAGYSRLKQVTLPGNNQVTYQLGPYLYEDRYVEGNETRFAPTIHAVTSATLDGTPIDESAILGDVPWDGISPLALHVDVPDGVGFGASVYQIVDSLPVLWTALSSDTNDIVLPAHALQFGEHYLLRVYVGRETATSRSGAMSWLGLFRLVRK